MTAPDDFLYRSFVYRKLLKHDANIEALGDAAVTFTTSAGRLDAGGGVLRTNARGEARDTLRVSAGEARLLVGQTIVVTVVAASGGSQVESSIVIPVGG